MLNDLWEKRFMGCCLRPFGLCNRSTIHWVAYKVKFTSYSSIGWEVQDQAACGSGVW